MRCRAFFISRLKRSQAWFKQESKQRQETSSDFVVSFGSLEQKLEFERDGLCLSGRFFSCVVGFSPLLPTPGFRVASRTGEAHFCAPAFSYVLRTKKGPLLCHIVLLQFP